MTGSFLVAAADLAAASTRTTVTLYVDGANGTATSGCTTSGAGACVTVQQAISAAEADINTDVVIDVAPGTYTENDVVTGVDGGTLTIQGAGAANTIIDGDKAGSVIENAEGSTLTVSGVTLENGMAQGSAGVNGTDAGAGGSGTGGGVDNEGTLTLTGDTLSDDHALGGTGVADGGTSNNEGGPGGNGEGGAVFNSGTATLTDDTLTGDVATGGAGGAGAYEGGNGGQGRGGGIDNVAGATLTLTDDTLVSTSAEGANAGSVNSGRPGAAGGDALGGGLANDGSATLLNVTFSENSTASGFGSGGGEDEGPSGQSYGGGLYNYEGTVALSFSTLYDDTAQYGHGLYEQYESVITAPQSISADGSIFDEAGCESSLDDDGITDGGYNVESDNTCGFSTADHDVVSSSTIGLITPLGANGSTGPETLALANAGSAFEVVPLADCPSTDERGLARPGVAGQDCDAGAFEWQTSPATLYVDGTNGIATSGCSTSGTGACETLPEAITAAESSTYAGEDVTIDVAGGIYAQTQTDSVTGVPGGGTLTIEGASTASTVINAQGDSADITVDTGATLTIDDVTIENGSGGVGGGVDNEGTVTLNDDTLTGNTASLGGGVGNHPHATATLINDTLTGNTATLSGGSDEGGGAIWSEGALSLDNDTLSDNVADSGDGGGLLNGEGTDSLTATIVARNTGTDCSGPIDDDGYNIDDDGSCGLGADSISDSTSVDSFLAASLAANGSTGPETLAITDQSPAFQLVPLQDCPTTDERGTSRPGYGGDDCDAGAFELQGYASSSTSTIDATTADVLDNGSAASTVTVTIEDVNGLPLAQDAVTLALGASSTARCSNVGGCTVDTNSAGVASFEVTDTAAETVALAATEAKSDLQLSGASVTFAALQTPLTLSTTEGTVGEPLTLGTHGGSGTGAVSFSLQGGAGCTLASGDLLRDSGVGTCTVIATKAASTGFLEASSPATTVTFTLPPVPKLVSVSWPVHSTSASLTSPVRAALASLARKLLSGASIVITAHGALGQRRAKQVETYLKTLVVLHVKITVTRGSAAVVTVRTTAQ